MCMSKLGPKPTVLWLGIGDGGDYNDVGDLDGAAEELWAARVFPPLTRVGAYGLTDGRRFPPPHDYISAFWGDQDAQPTRPLSNSELARLNSMLEVRP